MAGFQQRAVLCEPLRAPTFNIPTANIRVHRRSKLCRNENDEAASTAHEDGDDDGCDALEFKCTAASRRGRGGKQPLWRTPASGSFMVSAITELDVSGCKHALSKRLPVVILLC